MVWAFSVDRAARTRERLQDGSGLGVCDRGRQLLEARFSDSRRVLVGPENMAFRVISLHSLRHSHGSQLLSAGVPLPVVSKRLGHADPSITARIDSHAMEGDEVRAAEARDNLMRRTMGPKPKPDWLHA